MIWPLCSAGFNCSILRDFNIITDVSLSLQTHVQRTVAGGFAVLRQIRCICWSLPPFGLQPFVVSVTISKFDYNYSVLMGFPAYMLHRQQSIVHLCLLLALHAWHVLST
jgi:hypothetical protein